MTKSNLTLETNQYLKNCDPQDVISINSNGLFHVKKMCDLVLSAIDMTVINFIANVITRKLSNKCNAGKWFGDGEKCQILKADSYGWQKGKLKLQINLTLEFIPEKTDIEPSPLEDIRQEINSKQ